MESKCFQPVHTDEKILKNLENTSKVIKLLQKHTKEGILENIELTLENVINQKLTYSDYKFDIGEYPSGKCHWRHILMKIKHTEFESMYSIQTVFRYFADIVKWLETRFGMIEIRCELVRDELYLTLIPCVCVQRHVAIDIHE